MDIKDIMVQISQLVSEGYEGKLYVNEELVVTSVEVLEDKVVLYTDFEVIED